MTSTGIPLPALSRTKFQSRKMFGIEIYFNGKEDNEQYQVISSETVDEKEKYHGKFDFTWPLQKNELLNYYGAFQVQSRMP